MITTRTEVMSAEFTKHHIEGLPFPCAFHHFTGTDKGGPHDHPWSFRSYIMQGGYIERVYQPDGKFEDIKREPGTSFNLPAEHIHEIIELPQGECWTLVIPGPLEREWKFWEFDK